MRQQPVCRLAGLRGGADDGAGILAHDLQPRPDIIGMAHGRNDPERGAAEGRGLLGNHFLEGVFLRAERSGQISIETAVMAAGVTQLVQGRPMPVDRLEIGLWRRHLHVVEGRHIEGAITTDTEVDVGGPDQCLDPRFDQARRRWRRNCPDVIGQAIALRGIEDREPLQERNGMRILTRFAGTALFVLGVKRSAYTTVVPRSPFLTLPPSESAWRKVSHA